MLTNLFLDLDGTVYPNDIGMWQEIVKRIYQFMVEKLSIPEDEIIPLRETYFNKYGTTLRGLQNHYDIDSEAYLAYVHDIQLSKYLSPAPDLRNILEQLPQKKWIVTNADANHAHRVLEILGIRDLFDGLMGVSDIDYATKPDPMVFHHALKMANNPHPNQCLFADDLEKNLLPAKELGFVTLKVGEAIIDSSIDYACETIYCLPDIVAKSAKVTNGS